MLKAKPRLAVLLAELIFQEAADYLQASWS